LPALIRYAILSSWLISPVQTNIGEPIPGIIEIRCDGEPFYWVVRDKYGIIGDGYRVKWDIFKISLANPIVKVIEVCD
jgi:hypothetical protein